MRGIFYKSLEYAPPEYVCSETGSCCIPAWSYHTDNSVKAWLHTLSFVFCSCSVTFRRLCHCRYWFSNFFSYSLKSYCRWWKLLNRFDVAGLEAAFRWVFFPASVADAEHRGAGHLQVYGHFIFPSGKDFICILETWLSGRENCTAAGFLDDIHGKTIIIQPGVHKRNLCIYRISSADSHWFKIVKYSLA